MTRICPLTDAQVSAAAEVERVCLSTAWTERQIASLPDYARYLVAEEGAEVCGIASLYITADESELINLAVLPAFRGRGIAQALLDGVFAAARASGCTSMFLEVAASNAAAQNLYRKNGFEAVGKRVGFYQGEDALLLRKELC